MELYTNAHILTQNPQHSIASAMLVKDGKILSVGKEDQFQLADAKKIDVKGKTILPGFNDAHIHLWKVGQLGSYILDLRGIKSIHSLQELLKQRAASLPVGTWIVGRGFNEQVLEEKRMPNVNDLDAVGSAHPIYLIRTCAHIAAVNSVALQKANLTAASTAPCGGVIGKDDHGKLTGILYETALGLITKHIPEPTQEQYMHMIELGMQKVLSVGITSITDPAAHPDLLNAYQHFCNQNSDTIRMNVFPILLPDGGSKSYPLPPLFHSDHLNIDTVKFFSDGGLSGQTAAISRPYKGSSNRGVLRLEQSQFYELAHQAQEKGFRIATHAIGDVAIGLVIATYKKLKEKFGDQRNRIEHVGLPTNQHVNDMATHQFVAVPQPVFLYELGENFRAAVDDDFLSFCYPIKSLLDKNIPVALSTDAPVVSNLNPFSNIKNSILRKTSAGNTIAPQESITLAQALHAYTVGSAFAEKKEQLKGKIAEGQFADFIILDKNPFTVEAEDLDSIKVMETYVNGKCLWKQNSDTSFLKYL
jgi:predicted amidohydrolase YtcJ